MSRNAQVLRLLEEILESEKSPEEACRDFPELLTEVQRRWEEFQFIDLQVRTLLPGLVTSVDAGTTAPPAPESKPRVPAAFGRYQVQGPLGEGGFGAVYLGHDTQLNRPVAIKLLRAGARTESPDDEQVLQEARRLAQMRHPGIVAVHDVGTHAGQCYLVSDYIEGPDLGRWLLDHRPTWPEAVLVAASVAEALAYAHTRLIIHRDVKPANILLTADGAPVLVDFGLALDEAQSGSSAKGIVAGTPLYMSPEQAAGAAHRIDGRTDIYSLGVVLYEMLTGRVPFRAVNPKELLRRVRDDEPQPPRQLVSSIPPELERICLKAMAKQQHDRYSTAADFAAELRRVPLQTDEGRRMKDEADPASDSSFIPHPSSFPIKQNTVGRQTERAELTRAFESVAAGQGQFVCVTGEPGIGKTTLIEDLISGLASAGRPFFIARGRCSERLAGSEAYLPFLEALESLLHSADGEAVSEVMKRTAPNWYAQVARLADSDSSFFRVLAETKAASQERLKRELRAFLHELSHQRPLLLFVDDLHWADASTVDLLAYLGGKCTGMRALFVFTYRPSEMAVSKHPFGPVKLDLQAHGVCRELSLEFLSRADLDRYLALEFPEHTFPEEFAAFIHTRTEGSPLFMADLLRYLRDRQVLTQEHECWTLRQSIPDLRRELPESVRGMVQRKIDQLTDDDRRLLVAASVQGYEFDSAVLARVLEQDAADVEDRLDELDRIHAFVRMVREQEFPDRTLTVRYRFVHVLYENVLYAALQPTRRASLSAAVAQALLQYYGDRSVDVAADLALLLEAARDFAGAADQFLMAARNAARVFANQEAIALAHRGVEVLASLPDTPERARRELALQITLGPALFAIRDWNAPEVQMAYTRAHDLCRQLEESPDLFPALWGLFLFRIACGEIQAGLNQGGQLLSLAQRAQDPALLLQAHHAIGPAYGFIGEWATAQSHLDAAIQCYDRRAHSSQAFTYGGHDPCVCCQCYAAQALWMLGFPEQALQRGREALDLARELRHPTSLAHTQLSVAILHQFRRDVAETLNTAEALQALAADQGLLFYLAGGSVLRGWAMVEQGLSDEGLAQIRQGFESGGATSAHWRSYLLTVSAEACGKAGNVAEGLAVLEEAFAVVEKTGIRMYEPEMYRLKGELLHVLDPENSPEVEACFSQAIAIARRHQAKSLELRATMSLARFWERHGRADAARSALVAIYGSYTEGFTTSDLVDAERLSVF